MPADASADATLIDQGAGAAGLADAASGSAASSGASPSAPATTTADTAVDTTGGAAADTTTTTTTTTDTGNEPTDLLSAVRAVLKPETADPSPAAGSGAGGPAPGSGSDKPDPNATTTTDTETKDLTAADFADVEKPSVKKRIDTLLAQRASARTEVDTLREPAGYWQQHVEFLRGNNITPEDAQALYSVGQLLGRGDYANFVAAVRPYYELAMRQLGEILPEDIQRRVDTGDLSPEDARELSQARAQANIAEQQRAISEQRHGVADTTRQLEGVRTALSQWEQGISQRDPDFALKRDAVMRHAIAMRAERGMPPDPATAVLWANEALAQVNALFTAARPRMPATRAAPSSVTNGTKARPEPRNVLEAARYALEDMRT